MVSVHIEFPSGSGLKNNWDDGIEIANETPVNAIRCRPRTLLDVQLTQRWVEWFRGWLFDRNESF